MKLQEKKRNIILVVGIISFLVVEIMVLAILMAPEIKREKEQRNQVKDIDDTITLINESYKKYEFALEGGYSANVQYEIETNASILFMIVNEDGYDEFKEDRSVDDIDSDNLFHDKDIEDETEEGSKSAESNGFVIIHNTDLEHAKVEYEIKITPSVSITPGYVAFYWLIGMLNIIGIIIIVLIVISRNKNYSKRENQKESEQSPAVPTTSIERSKNYCTSCGEPIKDPSIRFCEYCGADLPT